MKELLNARFFSWLEECGGKDVTKDEVELVVGEFVADLEQGKELQGRGAGVGTSTNPPARLG